MLIQDYLDICDSVLTFDRFMEEIELEKYLKNIPQHDTGRLRYDSVSMLKTVLFGFPACLAQYNKKILTCSHMRANMIAESGVGGENKMDKVITTIQWSKDDTGYLLKDDGDEGDL